MPRKTPEDVGGFDADPEPGQASAEGGVVDADEQSPTPEAVPARPVGKRGPRKVLGRVAGFLFSVLFLVAILGALLYVADYKVDATVEDTRCDVLEVTVRTKQFGLEHTVRGIPVTQCLLLEPGNFVEYRIRTQRTTLYESEGGDCIYDSKTGPC
ncbi:MAG: hypothetical protein AABY18_09600 [Candidatus Thermoplasmatota archaeon]